MVESGAVVELRKTVQENKKLGITAAQDYCAALVHVTRRAWQQWENGDRHMHAAFFELASIKVVNSCHSPGDDLR